jgi:hypothetical protein
MKKLICAIVLTLCIGCTVQYKTYSVKLVRPDGVTHKSWVLKRTKAPIVHNAWGGQNYIVHGTHHIEAPTGWLLDIEEIE